MGNKKWQQIWENTGYLKIKELIKKHEQCTVEKLEDIDMAWLSPGNDASEYKCTYCGRHKISTAGAYAIVRHYYSKAHIDAVKLTKSCKLSFSSKTNDG